MTCSAWLCLKRGKQTIRRRTPFVRSYDVLACSLTLLLIAPETAWPQQPPPSPPEKSASQRPTPRGLRILVLQGQDAVNSLAHREAAVPVVQVFDYRGEPVEGAQVTFEVPAAGAGGVFSNQQNSYRTRTDARGQAVAPFTPNALPGKFSIRVVATLGDESAEAAIRQTNSSKAAEVEYKKPPHHWYQDWKWWALIGAGAGAGGYFAARGGTSSSNPTIGLAPGQITIGGPH